MSVTFFLGLATTMTLLGASATALGSLLLQYLDQVTLFGGAVIIVFGVMSVLGKGFAGMQIQDRPFRHRRRLVPTGCDVCPRLDHLYRPDPRRAAHAARSSGIGDNPGRRVGLHLYAGAWGCRSFSSPASSGGWTPRAEFGAYCAAAATQVSLGRITLHLHTTSVVSGLLLIGLGYLLASGQLTAFTEVAASGDLSLLVLDLDERLRQLFGLQ